MYGYRHLKGFKESTGVHPMKILTQSNIPSNLPAHINPYLGKVGHVGVVKDVNQLPKALNEYNPELLILESKYIDGIVKAYKDKNNVKVISFGENTHADIVIDKSTQLAHLEALNFKNDTAKTDVSVFCNRPEHVFITQFLCNNYNVKAYGPVKIRSPRYLGHISDIDKYEILSKSKISVTFDLLDACSSILLDTVPITHASVNSFDFKTFTNLVSLMETLEHVQKSDSLSDYVGDVKSKIKSNNAFSFTINMLQQLGFTKQAEKLNIDLEEMFK